MSGGLITSYSHHPKRIWSFSIYLGGGVVCQNWKGSTHVEFWFLEDGQNIIIHHMYFLTMLLHSHRTSGGSIASYSHQFKHIWSLPIFLWGGATFVKPGKGQPRGEFWSSEDNQNIIIHPMYSSNNVDALSLDDWGLDHILQSSPQAHLIISRFSGRGSYICRTWKGSPRCEFWSSEDGKNIIIYFM